ncbi:MAG: metallophosphoesterase [Oscillospiraceae bacterium]|nr:metallophosphoesterase [Oscillospiraceae bacterium]
MKKLIFIILAVLVVAALSVWIWHHNVTILTTHYTVSSEDLPESFDGFTIVQVSDLHNDLFGEGNCNLISAITAAAPDIIVLTGDIMDSYDTDLDIACEFIDGIIGIAPVYYITGNHEYRFPLIFEKFEAHMINAGVTVLRDKTAEIELNGETITIAGAEDPDFSGINNFKDSKYFADRLTALVPDEGFTLLLSHRPDIFETYCETGADLVLTGHAHGGQFRLPILGGLFAPQQGFLPDYSEGLFEKDGTTMIISRGLGNSAFPFRINNPPELVVVTLEAK